MTVTPISNYQRARLAWGDTMPDWILRMAQECDRTNQRSVADRIGQSNATVSKLINRKYAGSMMEMEQQVRATFCDDRVDCPAFGSIPLASCIRNRRRKTPAVNAMQRAFDRHCPGCPFNSDRTQSDLEEE